MIQSIELDSDLRGTYFYEENYFCNKQRVY